MNRLIHLQGRTPSSTCVQSHFLKFHASSRRWLILPRHSFVVIPVLQGYDPRQQNLFT